MAAHGSTAPTGTTATPCRLPQCAVLDMAHSDSELQHTAVAALSSTLTPVFIACNCGFADAAAKFVAAAQEADGYDLPAVARDLKAK